MDDADPFADLGIAPTLDRTEVKRAYFASVQRSPPHTDPERFQRIRAAYERLSDVNQITAAWLQASLDIDRELERFAERFDARIAAAATSAATRQSLARSVELLIDRCSRTRIG